MKPVFKTAHCLPRLLTLCCCLLLLVSTTLHAQKKTFTREYTYQASEDDSKNSARAQATTQMRNILLREVGEFLHAEQTLTQTDASQEYAEKIEAITAGVVEMKTLDERWDGTTYYIKAEMTVDPAEVNKRIEEVRHDKQKTKELEEARKYSLAAEAKLDSLRKELELAKNKNNPELRARYQQQAEILASNEHLTRGNIALNNGWTEEAIEEYKKAYAQMPKNETTYLLMGGIYNKAGRKGFNLSVACYKNYLEIYPDDPEVCILLADIYKQNDHMESARLYYLDAEKYYKNIIMSDPNNDEAYYKLSQIAYSLGHNSRGWEYKNKANEIIQKRNGTVQKKKEIIQKKKSHNSGSFLSYIYDSNPIKSAGPMHGISLFNFGSEHSRWGWYASLRANSAFFKSNSSQPVSSFAFNVGAILKLFKPVSLYFGPGVGSHLYEANTPLTGTAMPVDEEKREWYFNPELGIVLNFRYISFFGSLKYPLPKKDDYEKLLWSAGVGIGISEFGIGGYSGSFLSYIYDSNPIKSAGPMHGVSLFNFGYYSRWGWYASFRVNGASFQSNPSQPVSSFAFNAGAILKLGSPLSLYFGPGVGNHTHTAHTLSTETGFPIDEKEQEWYFNPELGIVLNFRYVTLSGGVKYPLPKKDVYEKFLWSAGAGITISDNDYDDESRIFLSYTPDIPVSSTSKNPPGYIGFTVGALGYSMGGYGSFRGNALMFGGGGGGDSDLAHIATTGGFIFSPGLYPLFLSVGLGGYWEWEKEAGNSEWWEEKKSKKIAYAMPEVGVHILFGHKVLLSFGRAFPGFKNDKIIYTTGIGILFANE
jgi:tetratricopeptide (TPR) repeat protein